MTFLTGGSVAAAVAVGTTATGVVVAVAVGALTSEPFDRVRVTLRVAVAVRDAMTDLVTVFDAVTDFVTDRVAVADFVTDRVAVAVRDGATLLLDDLVVVRVTVADRV